MTQRVIEFTDAHFKFMLANMTAHDVIHDYGIGKEDRWEANKDYLEQFQRDRYTFMNPRIIPAITGGEKNPRFVELSTTVLEDSNVFSFSKKARTNPVESLPDNPVESLPDNRIINPKKARPNPAESLPDITIKESLDKYDANEQKIREINEKERESKSMEAEYKVAVDVAVEHSRPFDIIINNNFFDDLVKYDVTYDNALDLLVEDVKSQILFVIFKNIFDTNIEKLLNEAAKAAEILLKEGEHALSEEAAEEAEEQISWPLQLLFFYYYITDGSEFMEDIFYKFVGYLQNYHEFFYNLVEALKVRNISLIIAFFEKPQTDIMIQQMIQEFVSNEWEEEGVDPDLGGGTTKYTGGASLKLNGNQCRKVRLRVYNFMYNIGILDHAEIANFNNFLREMNIVFNDSALGTFGRYTPNDADSREICDLLNGDDVRQQRIITRDFFGEMSRIFIAFTTGQGNPDKDLYINNLREIANECANVFEIGGEPKARILEISKNTILVPTITKSSRGYEPTSEYFYAHLKNRLLAYLSDYEGIITVDTLKIQAALASAKRAKDAEAAAEAKAAAADERAAERARAGHLGPDDVKFREGFCSFIAKASLHMCNIITATSTTPTSTQVTWARPARAASSPDPLLNPYLKRQAEILCKWANIDPLSLSTLGLGTSNKDADTELFTFFNANFTIPGSRKTSDEAKTILYGIAGTDNKIIIDNAAMSGKDAYYKNKFCPWSSINDAQPMCSAGTSDSIEYGNMDFKIQNSDGVGFYQCIMTVDPAASTYTIAFNITFPNGNTVEHSIDDKRVGDGFLKAKNAVGNTIGDIIDYLVGKSTPPTTPANQEFTDRVFLTFPNIFDQLFIEFLNGDNEIMQIIFKNILCKLIGDLLQEINAICEYGGYTGDNYNTTRTDIVRWGGANTPRIFIANDRPSALRATFAAQFATSGINTQCAVAYPYTTTNGKAKSEEIFMYIKRGATFTGGKTRKRIKLNKKTKKMSQSNNKTKKNKKRNSKKIKSKYYNKNVKRYSK